MNRAGLILSFALVAALSGLLGLLAGGGGGISLAAPRLAATMGKSPSFADVVQRVNPAVVHITAIQAGPADGEGRTRRFPGVKRGEGSGFIVDPSGYILTNHHLVASPERIRVRLADKREFPALLVGADPSTDLALLRVQAKNLPSVPMGDSDALRVGEWVCAIGNPYRFDHSVTVGVVSSKGRKIYDPSFDAYIQTDAAINPGNSGGPLINAAGEAVGINSAVSIQGQGIGFAVPINVARQILEPLRMRGKVSRGYLGIQLHELDPDLQKLLGIEDARGAVVLEVVPGEAAEKAGLQRYDVITAVSGRPVADGDQLVQLIAEKPPGTTVVLAVLRDGKRLELPALLTERGLSPEEVQEEDGEEEWEEDHSAEGDALGLVVGEMGKEIAAELRLPADRRGVMVKEVVGLAGGLEVVAQGDLVVEVNRHPTPTLAAYRKVLGTLKDGEAAWLFVHRPRPPGSFLTKLEVDRKPLSAAARRP
jgi:serine protease Do